MKNSLRFSTTRHLNALSCSQITNPLLSPPIWRLVGLNGQSPEHSTQANPMSAVHARVERRQCHRLKESEIKSKRSAGPFATLRRQFVLQEHEHIPLQQHVRGTFVDRPKSRLLAAPSS